MGRLSPFDSLPKMGTITTLERNVYDCLRKAIVGGKLPPGQKLVTAKIAEELGVSRMPVREAIQRLAAEGFAKMVPHKGAVVTPLSADDVEEIYNIRMVLEGYAMKLATQRVTPEHIAGLEALLGAARGMVKIGDLDEIQMIDDRFHRKLFAICGSTRLTHLLTNLWDQCVFFRSVAALLRRDLSLSIKHHEELIGALTTKDVERAVKVVQEHTAVSRDILVQYLRSKESVTDSHGA